MGTQRVQMKGVLPWLVRCALYAGTKGIDYMESVPGLVERFKIRALIFRGTGSDHCLG
jgi:hypothetical protein